jgi:hypothetical protein
VTENSEYIHPGATWYVIGVGGAGGNVVNAFFKSLEHKAVRIEPWLQFGKKTDLSYLTDVILKYGVPGKFGWWLYNTSERDLQNTQIVHEKLTALYPQIGAEQQASQNAESARQTNEARMRKRSTELIYKQQIRDHFTAGISQVEGAGKSWIIGKGGTDPLTDIEYFTNRTGRREPMIKYILDTLEKGLWRNTNGLLVVHGSARGTGSGATCRIIRCLKQLRSDLYVLTLSLLPSLNPGESRYEDAINQTTFSLLSVLRDENEKKLVGAVMLAHNNRLHELCSIRRKPFLYADKSLCIGQRRVLARLNREIGRDRYNGLLVDLLGLLSSTHILGREEEAFDLSNIVKAVEPPTSDPDFPGILVPCVYIGHNGNSTIEELITGALKEGAFVHCDPSTSRAIYMILFMNTRVRGNSLSDIYQIPDRTVNNLYPETRVPKLKTPDYVDTKGKFAAAIVFLINPRIPVIEQFISATEQSLEKIERTPPSRPQSEAVLMLEDWQNGLSHRAEKLLEMLGGKSKEKGSGK